MAYLSAPESPKRRKGKFPITKEGRKRFLLQAGFVLLMLGLIAFAVYQCARHMAVGLDTLKTQEITDESYVGLDLYIFRDEALISADGTLFSYEVSDGEKIGVGDPIATAYMLSGDVTELQAQLSDCAERIGLLERTTGQGTPTRADELSDDIDSDYLAWLSAAEAGCLGDALHLSEEMREQLNRYARLTGASGVAQETVATLRATQAALVDGLTVSDTLAAEKSGYFYYEPDGYEKIFDYGAVMTMTPEAFLAMTQASAETVPVGTAGKMVYSPVWYAAAYVSLADATVFQNSIGDSFSMVCSDGRETVVDMILMRMEPDANGALLVFRSLDMPDGLAFDRRMTVQTLSGSVSGYRIPAEALVTLTASDGGEVTGVYILAGNVVEFRAINIKVKRSGYIIADTYETVQAMSEEERKSITHGEWMYLNLNDKLITRGTGLYEGKMIS